MKVEYYPFKDEPGTSPLSKEMSEFRKSSFEKWRKMDTWIASVKRTTYNSSSLLAEIQCERKKAHKNRRVVDLDDGLYEWRGKQSQSGTIRIYFCFSDDVVYILDAEYKTDDAQNIDRARNRMKELNKLEAR